MGNKSSKLGASPASVVSSFKTAPKSYPKPRGPNALEQAQSMARRTYDFEPPVPPLDMSMYKHVQNQHVTKTKESTGEQKKEEEGRWMDDSSGKSENRVNDGTADSGKGNEERKNNGPELASREILNENNAKEGEREILSDEVRLGMQQLMEKIKNQKLNPRLQLSSREDLKLYKPLNHESAVKHDEKYPIEVKVPTFDIGQSNPTDEPFKKPESFHKNEEKESIDLVQTNDPDDLKKREWFGMRIAKLWSNIITEGGKIIKDSRPLPQSRVKLEPLDPLSAKNLPKGTISLGDLLELFVLWKSDKTIWPVDKLATKFKLSTQQAKLLIEQYEIPYITSTGGQGQGARADSNKINEDVCSYF